MDYSKTSTGNFTLVTVIKKIWVTCRKRTHRYPKRVVEENLIILDFEWRNAEPIIFFGIL